MNVLSVALVVVIDLVFNFPCSFEQLKIGGYVLLLNPSLIFPIISEEEFSVNV